MVQELKNMLLSDPDSIVSLLEQYDFCKITINSREIRFARDEEGGHNISIRLYENDSLTVIDYAHNIRCDLIAYIMQKRDTDFKSVLQMIKRTLGLSLEWNAPKKTSIFGGVYDRINKRTKPTLETYDEAILDQYEYIGNLRFLRDNISLESQHFFGIRYDGEDNCIIIPILSPEGKLMGVKARVNHDRKTDCKYFYKVPCSISQTLYGYYQNYDHLYNNKVYVFESEKSVMVAHSYGYRNCVALGSNSLSETQAKLLLRLNPEQVIFLLDEGLDLENTYRNYRVLRQAARMYDLDVCFWDWRESMVADHKESPIDKGKAGFEYVLAHEIVKLEV